MADNYDYTMHKLILTKIEALHDDVKYVKEDVKDVKKDVKKQNGRVRTLENKYNYFIGAMSIIGIVCAALWKIWK